MTDNACVMNNSPPIGIDEVFGVVDKSEKNDMTIYENIYRARLRPPPQGRPVCSFTLTFPYKAIYWAPSTISARCRLAPSKGGARRAHKRFIEQIVSIAMYMICHLYGQR